MLALKELTRFPICDTDVWIKLSKSRKCDLLFKQYVKILFADAVIYELNNKNEDNEEEFGQALINYRKEKKKERACPLYLSSGNYFSEEDRKAIIRLFVHYDIDYDSNKRCFIGRPKHLGERVSFIYATILKINIILTDDGGMDKHKREISNIMYRKSDNVKIISLENFLQKCGFEKKEIDFIIEEGNKSLEQSRVEKEVEKNFKKGECRMKSLTGLKKGWELKNKM